MKLTKSSSRLKTITTLFVIGLIIGQHKVGCSFGEVLSSASAVVGLSYAIYGILNDAHDTYVKFSTASTQDVMDKVVGIADNLDRIGNKLGQKIDNTLETLLRRLPLLNKIDQNIQDLNKYVTRVDSLYNSFEKYVKNPEDFDTFEVEEIIRTSLSRSSGDIRDVMEQLHSLIIPGRAGTLKKSLLLLLAEETQEYRLELCDTGAPPQTRIFELYSIVMITEIRAFALSGFAYLEKSMREEKNLMKSVKQLQETFELRVEQYFVALKEAMALAASEFRRCDPRGGHVRGETFAEFERFMQAFVVQETAIYSNNRCTSACGDMGVTRVYPGSNCKGFECSGSPSTCYGRIDSCNTLDGSASVCEFEPAIYARRYQFVIDGSGRSHGITDLECGGRLYFPGSWNEEWIFKCDLCRCVCTEEVFKSTSKHFVNLRPQESDIENNKIVVGIAFKMEKRILHLQILEGKLEGNGTISEETSVWKDLEDIEYDEDTSVNNGAWTFTLNGEQGKLHLHADIHVLIHGFRKFFLDSLYVPQHHVITGVKLNILSWAVHTSVPIYLSIRYTEFDYYTGELKNIENSKWMSYEDTEYGMNNEYRQDVDNHQQQSPLRKNKSFLKDGTNQIIEVSESSWYQDASQTVLPLLDALPVYGNPLTPLTGISLRQKAPEDAGGWLTFVVQGLNKAPYIKSQEDIE